MLYSDGVKTPFHLTHIRMDSRQFISLWHIIIHLTLYRVATIIYKASSQVLLFVSFVACKMLPFIYADIGR